MKKFLLVAFATGVLVIGFPMANMVFADSTPVAAVDTCPANKTMATDPSTGEASCAGCPDNVTVPVIGADGVLSCDIKTGTAETTSVPEVIDDCVTLSLTLAAKTPELVQLVQSEVRFNSQSIYVRGLGQQDVNDCNAQDRAPNVTKVDFNPSLEEALVTGNVGTDGVFNLRVPNGAGHLLVYAARCYQSQGLWFVAIFDGGNITTDADQPVSLDEVQFGADQSGQCL